LRAKRKDYKNNGTEREKKDREGDRKTRTFKGIMDEIC